MIDGQQQPKPNKKSKYSIASKQVNDYSSSEIFTHLLFKS